MPERVLIIFPHPDDEAFSCVGIVRSFTEKKIPVTYICLTLGEMGRNMGNPIFANRETLPLIRKKELEKACKIMGIDDVRLWGLRDKTLEFEPDLSNRIHEALQDLRPSLIISFYPGYSVHPDHEACAVATIQAIQKMEPLHRPIFYGIAFAPNSIEQLGEPDVVVDVQRFKEDKIAVLEAHASQSEGMLARITKFKDPNLLKRLEEEHFWKINL